MGRLLSKADEVASVAVRTSKPCAKMAAEVGECALDNAKYAQKTYREMFSAYGKFAGRSVDDVAKALTKGKMSVDDIPIEYIVRDGDTLILNTRSSQALQRAGIPRSQWRAVNMTGNAAAEARLSAQLGRNGLTSSGTSVVRSTAPGS